MSAALDQSRAGLRGMNRRARVFPPGRLALLKAEYPTTPCTRDLLERINALPGARAVTLEEMCKAANYFGLLRQGRRGLGGPPTEPKMPEVPLDPVPASTATIAAWSLNNPPKGEPPPMRLSAINARRIALGLPPFTIDRRR